MGHNKERQLLDDKHFLQQQANLNTTRVKISLKEVNANIVVHTSTIGY